MYDERLQGRINDVQADPLWRAVGTIYLDAAFCNIIDWKNERGNQLIA